MTITQLPLLGAYSIEPKLFRDNRGYFFEWLNTEKFQNETNTNFIPVQFNSSKSSKGVLRGLHFQLNPTSQAKLVAVTEGAIQDVLVDLRMGSPTYGQHHSEVIDHEKKNQLFIPKGFAHGFLVLSEAAEIFYAIDDFYSPSDEGGLLYNDPDLKIEWMLPDNEIILSEKDKVYKPFKERNFNFEYNV